MHFWNIHVSLLCINVFDPSKRYLQYFIILVAIKILNFLFALIIVLLHAFTHFNKSPECSCDVIVHSLLLDIVKQDQCVAEVLSRHFKHGQGVVICQGLWIEDLSVSKIVLEVRWICTNQFLKAELGLCIVLLWKVDITKFKPCLLIYMVDRKIFVKHSNGLV